MQHYILCVKASRVDLVFGHFLQCECGFATLGRRVTDGASTRMATQDSQPQRVGNVLKAILERLPLRERLREYALWPHWPDTVGATIAKHARPVRIRRGVLCVAVDSPVWMQELQFLKESIRAQLNVRVGSEVVSDIFFVLDGNGSAR